MQNNAKIWHEGYVAGQRSMDAEHYAVALRLMHLPLDGGSHENLSQIARAVYHSDFGWTQGACMELRDKLVELMGGAHKPDAALPAYDVLGNERHKAVCRLREIQTDAGSFVKALANALGVEWQAPRVHQTIAEVRDQLIHLLGGDTKLNSQKSSILANSDGKDGGKVTITDELRKYAKTQAYPHNDRLRAIADRIDEQFDRICQQQETVLQSTIEQMADENLTVKYERDYLRRQMDQQRAMLTEQRDSALAKVLKLEFEKAEWRRGAERDADKLESLTGAYNDAVAEREKLQDELKELQDKLKKLEGFDPDIAMAAYGDDNDELRRLLYRSAKLLVNAEQDRDSNYAYWMDCKEKVVQKSVTIDELSKELDDMAMERDELQAKLRTAELGCDANHRLAEANAKWADALLDLLRDAAREYEDKHYWAQVWHDSAEDMRAKLDAIREAVDAL